eukprot:gene15666-6954_t
MDSLLIGSAGVAASSLVLWWFYRNKRDYCEVLEDLKQYQIGDELTNKLGTTPNSSIPYCSIIGLVKGDETPLTSTNAKEFKGVILESIIAEHRTEWNSDRREWNDVQRIISSNKSTVAFSLEGEDGINKVGVTEPLWANGLSFVTVYNHFEPVVSSLTDNLFGFASGDKLKGYERTERMLLEGTKLTALGKVQIVRGKTIIGPPDGSLKYILSTDSLENIVRSETNFAKHLRRFSIALAVLSSTLFTVWLCRLLRKWYVARKQRLEFEKLRKETVDSAENGNECVICMERPRNIVILNCGHICVCKTCGDVLVTCPICRAQVVKVVPTYVVT